MDMKREEQVCMVRGFGRKVWCGSVREVCKAEVFTCACVRVHVSECSCACAHVACLCARWIQAFVCDVCACTCVVRLCTCVRLCVRAALREGGCHLQASRCNTKLIESTCRHTCMGRYMTIMTMGMRGGRKVGR